MMVMMMLTTLVWVRMIIIQPYEEMVALGCCGGWSADSLRFSHVGNCGSCSIITLSWVFKYSADRLNPVLRTPNIASPDMTEFDRALKSMRCFCQFSAAAPMIL